MTARPVTILIAEDDDQDFHLAEHALRETGAANALVRVKDGADLMDYLLRKNRYADPPELPWPMILLLDLRMPKKDGWEALSEIKAHARLRLMPVVVFTTSKEPNDIVRCYELGASSYLKKPLGLGELLKIFQAVKSYWLESVEFPA